MNLFEPVRKLAPSPFPGTGVSTSASKQLNILGIRGLPAAHGGFETFAGRLAPYLRDKGWRVNVYCQLEPDGNGVLTSDFTDEWEGIQRTHLGTRHNGSAGSMTFDWRCILDVQSKPGIDLVLGYNTAVFSVISRIRGRRVVMNMDGVEWKRAKWSLPIKAWFYLNEFIGANISSVPIADHPEIARHLRRHLCTRAVTIPYGADTIDVAPDAPIAALGLVPQGYITSIARIEPENSILEIVQAFSARPRNVKMFVLGKFEPENNYHRSVMAAASSDVVFPGAIYDQEVVSALRFYALAYVHGHQVGGTNPSLVEALGAGSAVIAHDNPFNRWVAGPDQFYFKGRQELERLFDEVLDPAKISKAKIMARKRHAEYFTINRINRQYEDLLLKQLATALDAAPTANIGPSHS